MKKTINYSKFLFIVLIAALQGCSSIRLISDYDETTDKLTTEIQQKVSEVFVKIERNIGTSKAEYSNFTDQYDEIRVLVNTLEVRANSIDKNKIVQDQVKEIISMLDNLEKLHKLKFNDVRELTSLKDGFNRAFSAIIKLQTGLKRGKS
jgi:hypothetical protein